MDKIASIRKKAFINELYKIAVNKGCSDLYNFIKKASFIDEKHIINSCGSGKTILIKSAAEEYYEPERWKAVSGFHKAVAEDPEKYESGEIKKTLLGAFAPTPLVLLQMRALKNASEEAFTGIKGLVLKYSPEGVQEKTRKRIFSAINRKFAVPTGAALIGGMILAPHILKDKYLENRGIKKDFLGNYSFNEQAKQKYL